MANSKIVAVSYLNSIPFIYGIEHSAELRDSLLLAPPSGCAEAFANHTADIALLPVGALDSVGGEYEIITPYCIGASGNVRTVVIMSNVTIDKVKRIFLDTHSRTSVLLGQVLCRKLWHIEPLFEPFDAMQGLDERQEGDAFLIIGDKVFAQEGRFGYTYDLAEAWRELTALPFVFAVWVARKNVDNSFVDTLQNALKYGIAHTAEAIEKYHHSDKAYALSYLTENIDYNLDAEKLKALELFRVDIKG